MSFENLQISVEDIPSLEEVSFQPHPVKLRSKQLLTASIFLLLLLIPVIVFIFTGLQLGILIGGIVWIIIASLVYAGIYFGFRYRGYAVRQQDITYKKGWIFRSRTTVPFNRIQHSEINQGPLDRKYGISSLKIFTAGGATSDLTIPGLPPEEAERLHEFITEQTSAHA